MITNVEIVHNTIMQMMMIILVILATHLVLLVIFQMNCLVLLVRKIYSGLIFHVLNHAQKDIMPKHQQTLVKNVEKTVIFVKKTQAKQKDTNVPTVLTQWY
jgi:hypothetical protein